MDLSNYQMMVKHTIHVHQNKPRNFTNPKEQVQAEIFLSLVLNSQLS